MVKNCNCARCKVSPNAIYPEKNLGALGGGGGSFLPILCILWSKSKYRPYRSYGLTHKNRSQSLIWELMEWLTAGWSKGIGMAAGGLVVQSSVGAAAQRSLSIRYVRWWRTGTLFGQSSIGLGTVRVGSLSWARQAWWFLSSLWEMNCWHMGDNGEGWEL